MRQPGPIPQEYVQPIDFKGFFDAQFFIKLSKPRNGAASRRVCTWFPTKLSTENVDKKNSCRWMMALLPAVKVSPQLSMLFGLVETASRYNPDVAESITEQDRS